ncbi:MAG TPA: hypothetical protein VM820_15120, partial [Vicinamibacterales bacterium]|nr:hypothetical protein [Vicinamibacterales bacterium]
MSVGVAAAPGLAATLAVARGQGIGADPLSGDRVWPNESEIDSRPAPPSSLLRRRCSTVPGGSVLSFLHPFRAALGICASMKASGKSPLSS